MLQTTFPTVPLCLNFVVDVSKMSDKVLISTTIRKKSQFRLKINTTDHMIVVGHM